MHKNDHNKLKNNNEPKRPVKENTSKRVLRIIKRILVWVAVIAAVSMVIFTIVSATIFNRNDRDLFGYKAFIVRSDSMSATDFKAGDLILIKEVDPATLKEGDIIAYQSRATENYGEVITHKIRTLTTTEDGVPAFITYGTTTGVDDAVPVTYEYVLGKHAGTIPGIGKFFSFLKTTPGYIVCILLPFLILIVVQVINTARLYQKYKQEQQKELQLERKQLEATREELQRMAEELKKMRAEMGIEGELPIEGPAQNESLEG
jgi:signal peptidase